MVKEMNINELVFGVGKGVKAYLAVFRTLYDVERRKNYGTDQIQRYR